MVDAWGGWSLFQALLQTLKGIASKHGATIPNVAVKYILDQVEQVSTIMSEVIGFFNLRNLFTSIKS